MTMKTLTRGRWVAVAAAAVLVSSGCAAKSTSDSAGDSDQVKIGWISDLSGAASIAGIGNRDGAKLAVKKINADGGVLGKKIKLDVVDEACKPETALAATQRFIDSSDTFMIAGGSCSGDVMAMKDVVTEAKVPFYVASASSVDIVEPASRYVFGNMVNTEQEAEFLTAAAVEKFKPKKLGIIYSANDYGQTGQEKVTATAKKLNVDIGASIKVPVGTTDFSPFIVLLKKQGVDVVIPVIYEVPASSSRPSRTTSTQSSSSSGRSRCAARSCHSQRPRTLKVCRPLTGRPRSSAPIRAATDGRLREELPEGVQEVP